MIHKLRILFIIIFIIIGVVAAVISTGIGPLTKQEEFLPNSHEIMILMDDVGKQFSSASNLKDSIVVKLTWGIKGLDRSDVALWDPSDLGKL